MWVYEEKEEGSFEVGHWAPDKKWHKESEHTDQAAAAHRVHFLNGGTLPYRPASGTQAGNTAAEPATAAAAAEPHQAGQRESKAARFKRLTGGKLMEQER